MRPGCVVALIVGVFCLLTVLFLGLPGHLLILLVAGWFFFLKRTIPEIRLDPGSVTFALSCLAVFAGGAHGFCDWLFRQWHTTEPLVSDSQSARARRWPLRWTLASITVILLMFVAGMAATGVAHQVGWLVKSPVPITQGGGGQAARRALSTNSLKQIAVGLQKYDEANQTMPAGGTFDVWGRGLHSWQTYLLPYIEKRTLFDQIELTLPWDHPRNAAAMRTEVPHYEYYLRNAEPDPRGFAQSDYAANIHVLNAGAPRSMASIADGASNTFLAGEVITKPRPWGDPRNWRDPALGINKSPDGFGGPYPGGASLVFADGSVKFVKNTIDPRVLRMLATPSGGERVTPYVLDNRP